MVAPTSRCTAPTDQWPNKQPAVSDLETPQRITDRKDEASKSMMLVITVNWDKTTIPNPWWWQECAQPLRSDSLRSWMSSVTNQMPYHQTWRSRSLQIQPRPQLWDSLNKTEFKRSCTVRCPATSTLEAGPLKAFMTISSSSNQNLIGRDGILRPLSRRRVTTRPWAAERPYVRQKLSYLRGLRDRRSLTIWTASHSTSVIHRSPWNSLGSTTASRTTWLKSGRTTRMTPLSGVTRWLTIFRNNTRSKASWLLICIGNRKRRGTTPTLKWCVNRLYKAIEALFTRYRSQKRREW